MVYRLSSLEHSEMIAACHYTLMGHADLTQVSKKERKKDKQAKNKDKNKILKYGNNFKIITHKK